jgi:hypothetical protein
VRTRLAPSRGGPGDDGAAPALGRKHLTVRNVAVGNTHPVIDIDISASTTHAGPANACSGEVEEFHAKYARRPPLKVVRPRPVGSRTGADGNMSVNRKVLLMRPDETSACGRILGTRTTTSRHAASHNAAELRGVPAGCPARWGERGRTGGAYPSGDDGPPRSSAACLGTPCST